LKIYSLNNRKMKKLILILGMFLIFAVATVDSKDKPVVWRDYICPTCHYYSGCITTDMSKCPQCEGSLMMVNCKPVISNENAHN
jgi:hypothetical protein